LMINLAGSNSTSRVTPILPPTDLGTSLIARNGDSFFPLFYGPLHSNPVLLAPQIFFQPVNLFLLNQYFQCVRLNYLTTKF
jgi:hypothetical protein